MDDITILVRGKYDHTISNRMQSALNYTLKWCDLEGLSINPSKTVIIPFTRRRKYSIADLQLRGVQLKLSKRTKYLGVILDHKLNWNDHLEYAISKASSALWACSNTFGKKWGLKPRMIHWIYSAIVRPRLTYASLLWWPKTTQITAQKMLGKLQRMACSSITGAMTSTPSKALDALLYLLPLHQFVQLEAEKGALRLRRVKHFQDGDLNGHLRIIRDFQLNTLVIMNEDWMETRTNFDIPFKVIETDRRLWEEGGPKTRPGSLLFYTDGSKIGKSTGAGVTGPGIDISIPMGQCQAALNALKAYTCQSKLVWECILSLRQLALTNNVNLYWVPGHAGIEKNEKADLLARIGSSTEFVGPEPFCGVSTACVKAELKVWESSTIDANWRAVPTLRQSKRFITPCKSITRSLISLNKMDLSTLTGLLTGHCPSRYHLKNIGKLTDDICRFCNFEIETSEHILCQCSALIQRRLRILGEGVLTPSEIWSAETKKMVYGIEHLMASPPMVAIGRDPLSGLPYETRNNVGSIGSIGSGKRKHDTVQSEMAGLSREERRRRRRATLKYRTAHATRERIRVEAFNVAFTELRKLLPTLPPDKKLSKIEILKGLTFDDALCFTSDIKLCIYFM
ncbi:uncharacterized protein LOC128735819 [Sabethes cyaneus]|uniref:uncharacterized protein LOC128735819 n=1 Tax=Sabethes cyaneus TaxID=53552 RepID=UPI00237EC766|nr:uncharacterized protein LOC128735819 [Sabethes cyaneus]